MTLHQGCSCGLLLHIFLFLLTYNTAVGSERHEMLRNMQQTSLTSIRITEETTSTNTTKPPDDSPRLELILPLVFVIVAALVVGGWFLYRYFLKPKYFAQPRHSNPEAPVTRGIDNPITLEESLPEVPVASTWEKKSEEQLRAEFRSLFATQKYNKPQRTAQMNIGKNRYIDVLPFDDKLVRLNKVNYINASYVLDGFIATQDPYPDQDDDFWQMLWETGVRVVVRLSTDTANQATARYIDDCGESTWVMGHDELRVTLTHKMNQGSFYMRTLRVVKDQEARVLEHYHMSTWADKQGVADHDQILGLVAAARDARDRTGTGNPVLIHCGAGVGRTGTVLAIWALIDAHLKAEQISLAATVRRMRECRPYMVQSEDQYVCVYQCVENFKQNPSRWMVARPALYEMTN